MNVIDTGLSCQVQDSLDDALSHVGTTHRWKRQGDVVEGDRQLHIGYETVAQRLGILAKRVVQCVDDRLVRACQPGQWLGGIDDARPTRWKRLNPESFAVMEHDRRRRTVDVEHEPWSWCAFRTWHLLLR